MSAARWLPVVGSPSYEVSDRGEVRSWVGRRGRRRTTPRMLTASPTAGGYLAVHIESITTAVHVLVAKAFHGLPQHGQVVRHLNGNPTDNRPDNLVWGTQSENNQDTIRHGRHHWTNKSHCPQGHAYDEANTFYSQRGDGRRFRRCRACYPLRRAA